MEILIILITALMIFNSGYEKGYIDGDDDGFFEGNLAGLQQCVEKGE